MKSFKGLWDLDSVANVGTEGRRTSVPPRGRRKLADSPATAFWALVIVTILLGSAAFLSRSAQAASELYIRDDSTGGDCTSIGTWDSSAKTCTLTTDVDRMIVLNANGLTLDGNGHRITNGYGSCDLGPYSWCAVKATGRSGLTVKNVVVIITGGEGIWLENSPDSKVLNNTLRVPGHAIHLYRSSNSIVKGNVVVNPSGSGCGCVYLQESHNLLVADNQVSTYSGQDVGAIEMSYGHWSVVSGNVVTSNRGIRVLYTTTPMLSGNIATGTYAIQLKDSDHATIVGNTATSNLQAGTCGGKCTGIYLASSPDATITGNTATGYNLPPGGSGGAYGYGLWLQDSARAAITGNTLTGIGEWGGNGITLLRSGSSTASGNTVTASHIGIHVPPEGPSGSNVINGNTISGSRDGIVLDSQSATTISENKVTVNGVGIQLIGNWGPPSGNLVDKNDVRGAYVGIRLGRTSSSNLVSDNVVSDGRTGISVLGPLSSNVVKGNLIAGNQVGIDLLGISGAIEYNQVYYNCFLDNLYQLTSYVVGAGNVWNDRGNNPSGGTAMASPWGNYWSDYHGLDDGSGGRPRGDGVGDTRLPHQVFDSYPLMSPTMPNYGRVCGGNAAPTILLFTATTVEENSPTVFTVAAADPENSPLTYFWDLDGDGSYESSGTANTASRIWGDDHQGIARVQVSDGELTDEETTAVTVLNARPQATFTVGEAVEGSPLGVSVRITDPGSDDIVARMEWGGEGTDEHTHFVDPVPDAPESTDVNPRDVPDAFSHTYGDDTNRKGTLTLTDDDGGTASFEIDIVVVNGEPQVTFAEVSSGDEAVAVAFTGTARDPGTDDLQFCWGWDDGTDECRTYYADGTFPFWATDSGAHLWGDNADFEVSLTVTDDDGGRVTVTRLARIANVAPVPSLTLSANEVPEGTPVEASAAFEDQGTDDVTLTLSWVAGPTRSATFYNDGVGPDPPKSSSGTRPFLGQDSMVHMYLDDAMLSVSAQACDDDGGCATATAPLTVTNVAPTVLITAPAIGSVYAVGEPVTFSGAFTDPGTLDVHNAQWMFDSTTLEGTVTEAAGSGTVTDTYVFLAPGVYYITLVIVDDDGGAGTATTIEELTAFVVIYDPNGGFVTGGGWIPSPPGAWSLDPSLTGKASFGFVAKYQNGKSLPTGETEFQFKVADLNFHSTSYDWLVCGGPKCQFRGQGTVDGVGGYSFLLSAIDGQLPGGGGQDKLRMKIWVTLTGQIVYDNQMGADDFADPTTVIGGGSIVIHKG